jgi:hypothetical protein
MSRTHIGPSERSRGDAGYGTAAPKGEPPGGGQLHNLQRGAGNLSIQRLIRNSPESSGHALCPAVRLRLEALSGTDLGSVRLHSGGRAAEAVRSIRANAFTIGSNIFLHDDAPPAETPIGLRLIAHEVAHTIQNQQASVATRTFSSPEDRSEREARSWADAVVTGVRPGALTGSSALISGDWQSQRGGSTTVVPDEENVQVYQLSDEEFKTAVGIDPRLLPEDVPVKDLERLRQTVRNAPADILPPGVGIEREESRRDLIQGGAAAGLTSPAAAMSFIPPNCTGVLWVEAGHISVFANVEGQTTIRGFRGKAYNYFFERFPKIGNYFSERINIGIEGAFRNDLMYAKMPGQQTVIYVAADRDIAEAFRDHLIETEYNQEYRYSPPRPNESVGGGTKVSAKERRLYDVLKDRIGEAQLVRCVGNCTTVPAAQFEQAIGMHPQVETPKGTLDVVTGRINEGTPNPFEAGRAARTREFFANPDLSQAKPGAQRIRMTAGAGKTMVVVRTGGTVLLLVGGYHSVNNLADAWGTEQFGEVLAVEAAGWAGGLGAAGLVGAVTEDVGAMLLAREAGLITFRFIMGSTAIGLVAGYFGSKLLSSAVQNVIEFPERMRELMSIAGDFADAYVAFGNQAHEGMVGLFIRPFVVAHESVNPGNWHLSKLGAGDSAIQALGAAAFSKLPTVSLDEFRDQSQKTFAQLGVKQELAAAAAQTLTAAGSPTMTDELMAMRPIDFVDFLKTLDYLEFIRDPEKLADEQVYEEGAKVDEMMLNVRAAPLIEQRARINPNNWNLDALGPRADDVLTVGRTIWATLHELKFNDFDQMAQTPMSKMGVTEEMMFRAARVMLKSRDFVGLASIEGESVPEDIAAEYARGLIGGNPNDFVYALEEQLHLTFRTEPSAIAAAALVWMRAGYQPW